MLKRGKGKISNSYNPKEAYRQLRRDKNEAVDNISESDYLKIIKTVNLLLEKEFLKGNEIKLPHRMGSIELRKKDTVIFYDKKGDIKTNRLINWSKTRELWKNDKECLESKILVRENNKVKPCVKYNKSKAIYKHKEVCKFKINRKIIQKAYIMLEEGDCFIFNEY